jgi:hypothetical protein
MHNTNPFQIRRKFVAIVAFLGAAAAFSGCTTTVQLAPEGKSPTLGEYKFGYLIVQPNQKFETVREATKQAFKDLGYFLVKDDIDPPGSNVLHARDAQDTIIEVKLKDFGTFTNVKVRYGIRGELALEQKVYQAIAKNF